MSAANWAWISVRFSRRTTVGRRRSSTTLMPARPRATASKIPVILAVLDGNLMCSYNVYYWHIFNNHPNYGCKSLEYSQNFRSITVSGLPYLMKNPHFDAVALLDTPSSYHRIFSRDRWSSWTLARCFAQKVLARFVPEGPIELAG